MAESGERRERVTRAVRWLARGWSVASVALILAFIVGEGLDPVRLTAAELLGFVFFPLGICIGMVVAWWREGLGGALTVGSLPAFYVVHLAAAGRLPRGAAWLAFAAPGFLFLVAWYRSRGAHSPA